MSGYNILYVIRFLTKLNEEFNLVKFQNLLIDPLSSLNKIVFLGFYNMNVKFIMLLLLRMILRYLLMQLIIENIVLETQNLDKEFAHFMINSVT